jgi:hypothetical protein
MTNPTPPPTSAPSREALSAESLLRRIEESVLKAHDALMMKDVQGARKAIDDALDTSLSARKLDAATQQRPTGQDDLPDNVLEICTAYESGFGQPHRNLRNPYTAGTNQWHAYAHGKETAEARIPAGQARTDAGVTTTGAIVGEVTPAPEGSSASGDALVVNQWRQYWLIEKGSPAIWLMLQKHPYDYPPGDANIMMTKSSHEALQFNREEDARSFLDLIYPGKNSQWRKDFRIECHADEIAATHAAKPAGQKEGM